MVDLTNSLSVRDGEMGLVMSRSKVAGTLLAFAVISLGASPALAHSEYSPDGGAHVNDGSQHITLFVHDISCDNHAVYGNWNNTDNRQDNSEGCGRTVSRDVGNISSVRACTNIPLAHDPCSSFG